MEAWIQRHDFSLASIPEPTVEQCLDFLQSFDWESELTCYEEALAEKRNRCPPALRLVDGDRTLQVMPIRGGAPITRTPATIPCGFLPSSEQARASTPGLSAMNIERASSAITSRGNRRSSSVPCAG